MGLRWEGQSGIDLVYDMVLTKIPEAEIVIEETTIHFTEDQTKS